MAAPIKDACIQYHKQIPNKARWLSCLKEALSAMSVDGALTHGSGCTGTDIFAKVVDECLDFWQKEFLLNFCANNALQAESNAGKQVFLTAQFNATLLCADVAELSSPKAFDIRHKKVVYVPWAKIFGGGFSCTDISAQNMNRKCNRGMLSDACWCILCDRSAVCV